MLPTCAWCGTDAYVDDYDVTADLAYCTGPGHAEPRMFEPKAELAARKAKAKGLAALSDGIAHRLGLYTDLPPLVRQGEWAETGVIEHRYAQAHREPYAWMLDRWGHVSQGSRTYTTTTFIGSTLGQLSRTPQVTYKEGRGTGFARGSNVGYWTTRPIPDDVVTMTWDKWAQELGIDPREWPFS